MMRANANLCVLSENTMGAFDLSVSKSGEAMLSRDFLKIPDYGSLYIPCLIYKVMYPFFAGAVKLWCSIILYRIALNGCFMY